MKTAGFVLSYVLVFLCTESAHVKAQSEQTAEVGGAAAQAWTRWASSVPAAERKKAEELFAEGNKFINDGVFVKAAEKYRAALTHWDHPSIHYNLALALLNLDQPIQIHHALERALRFGPEPLGPQKFAHAKDYKRLIRKQIVWVEVTCDEPDARVTVNGKLAFIGPGKYEGFVLPGKIHVVATKPGYVTSERTRMVRGGSTSSFDLKLFTPKELTRYRRHVRGWIPWTVAGLGLGLAAGGGVLHWQADDGIRAYDQAIEKCGGCVPTASEKAMLTGSITRQKIAVSSYIAGGSMLITGLVLAYVNRAQPYRIDEEQAETARRHALTPIVAPGQVELNYMFRF